MTDEKKSHLIPDGTYLGRMLSATPIISENKGTRGYEIVCQIEENGPYKGKKLINNSWMTAETEVRTLLALGYGGCTFPKDDIMDTSGVDTNEVAFVIDHEEYTPKATEANPNPKMTTRNVVQWINKGLGGRAGKPVEDTPAARQAFNDAHKGALALARQGRSAEGGADVPKDKKSGKAVF